jgi:hypothetical protein
MSRLSKLIGRPIEVDLGGEMLEIFPLKLRELPLLMKMGNEDPDKQADALMTIITKTLRTSVPDATTEEIDSIALTHFQNLTEAIMKVNGLENITPNAIGQSKLPKGKA